VLPRHDLHVFQQHGRDACPRRGLEQSLLGFRPVDRHTGHDRDDEQDERRRAYQPGGDVLYPVSAASG